jgi:hypothetical protein
MILKDFITKDYLVLKSFDTGEYALPVMVDKMYWDILSEKDILEMANEML